MDKDEKPTEGEKGRRTKMATQIQATPVLYGIDAKRLLDELDKKPTKSQLEKAEQRNKFFKQIKKKGF